MRSSWWRARISGGAVLVAVLGLVAAGPAAAGSLNAGGTRIIDFADVNQPPTTWPLSSQLTTLRALYCRGKGDRGGPLSLNGALAIARQLVSADSNGRGLNAFARSRAGRKESTSIAAAAGALGLHKPAAVLAALLRAHQLKPSDPVPLIDAAALLSEAGKGRAALAFLDAAKRLKPSKTSPFGISWSAISQASRGQALIVTHSYRQAETALNAALKSAPLLREAEQNMAVAYDCQGNTKKATQFLVAAVRRQKFTAKDFVTIPGDPFGQLDLGQVLDTSKGKTLTLQTIDYPESMKKGWEQYSAFVNWQQQLDQQSRALREQGGRDGLALAKQMKYGTLTYRRTYAILTGLRVLGGYDPALEALDHAVDAASDRMSVLDGQSFTQINGCKNAGLHGAWLAATEGYDAAMRRYAVALYRRQTALAANLKNRNAHNLAMDDARLSAVENLRFIVGGGHQLTFYDLICYQKPAPEGGSVDRSGTNQMPPSLPCPSGLIGPDFSFSLLVFSLSATCEEVTFDLAVGEGWVNAFISLSHNFKTGSNTIFAGPQLGAKLEIGPVGAGVTARGGLSVTFGADGSVQDIGMRATSSSDLTVGPGTASVSGPSASLSFLGAFTYSI